jgi:two-component system cell cycle sensor histidine kinase/response regulator CckA
VESVHTREARAQLLADVSLTLNARVDDLSGALEVAVELIGEAIGDTCSIYLLSDDGQWLDCVAQHIRDPVQRGLGEAVDLRRRRFHIEGNQLGDVVRSGTTRFSPELPEDAIRQMVGPDHKDLSQLKAFGNIMTPLRARGEAIGLVSVTRTVAGAPRYTEDDRSFLEELAGRAAVAIDAARLYRRNLEVTQALAVSEQRLRAMFNSTRVGIVARDANGRVVDCNRAYAEMLGFEQSELIGSDYAGIVDPGERERRQERYRRVFEDEQEHLEFEHTYVRPDGSPVQTRITASLVRDASGRPAYTLALVEDVSERHRLEQQLVQAQKMEAVGRLAGGVAHDFNNLLTAILGFNEIMAAELADDDPLQLEVNEIRGAAERANALTRQLLTFGRRHLIRRAELAPNEVVEALAPMLRRLLGEDVALELALQPGAGVVRADRSQLEQVIVNLAINARDAMPDGGRLTIATAVLDVDAEFARTHLDVAEGRYLVLAVSDTGHGMDAETQEHMFEPFYTTKAESHGTGLGLATVYGIVKQTGGSISVYSEPGHGTTFRIYLAQSTGVGTAAPAAELEQAPEAAMRGGQTILVAEDDRAVRAIMERALERAGYTVLSAAGPDEALALSLAHEGRIDLLLTDMIMPGMSGPALADRIALDRPGIRVLYSSGYSGEEIIRRGLDPDLPFIEKPFMPDVLSRKIQQVLQAPAEPPRPA